jgi:hypothetical protein
MDEIEAEDVIFVLGSLTSTSRKGPIMKQFREFVVNTLVGGLLIVAPIHIAVLLLLKAMKSFSGSGAAIRHIAPRMVPR